MKLKKISVCCSVFFGIFVGCSASANISELTGFGSKMTALGGAGSAGGSEAFGAYYNPAGLAIDSERRLLLSWGLVFMQPHFTPIQNVVTQNNYIADTAPNTPTFSDVETSYRNTFGQQLGLSYRLSESSFNPTVGIALFLPLDQTAFFDTGESYVPEYVLYRARTQRPQVEAGGGINLGNGFHLGAGFHVGFALTSNAAIFINTKDQTTSSMRFMSSIKAKASPYFGLLYTTPVESPKFSLGTVLRFPVTSDNTMVLKSAARAFGNLAAIDFNLNAISALFYDPMSLELGTSWEYASWGRLFAQLDYQVWSQFKTPALQIQQPEGSVCDTRDSSNPSACNPSTVRITPTILPEFKYVNILVPRIGDELTINDVHKLRLGYSYRPSIFKDIPNGAGNYLDPPKHMFNLGLGLNYRTFLGYDIPMRLDINLTYHVLLTQKINKTSGNEIGAPGFKVGYPSYNAGGNIFGGGVTLALAF